MQAFAPIDDAFEYVVEHLVGGIGQHQLTQEGYERGDDHEGGVENVREHFFQIVPPCPTGHTVGIVGGNGDFPGIIDDFVQFDLVQITPQVLAGIVSDFIAYSLDAKQ